MTSTSENSLSLKAIIWVGVSLVSKGKNLFVMHFVIVSKSWLLVVVLLGFFKWLLRERWKNRALSTVKYRSQQIMTNFKSVLNCEKQCITLASTRIHRLLLYSNRAFVKLCYCISLFKLHTGISFISTFISHKTELKQPFPYGSARNLRGLESEFSKSWALGLKALKSLSLQIQ